MGMGGRGDKAIIQLVQLGEAQGGADGNTLHRMLCQTHLDLGMLADEVAQAMEQLNAVVLPLARALRDLPTATL